MSAQNENLRKAREIVDAFSTGASSVLRHISDAKYIQHNLAFPDGKKALLGFFSDKPTGIDVTVHRGFAEGDFAVLHSTYGGAWNDNTPQVAFDVFRFEDGQAVEHWDNLLDVRGKNASDRTQTDGTAEIVDLDQTEQNKQIVRRLMNECFIGGDYSKVAEMISPKQYLQHNPDAADGLDGFKRFCRVSCQEQHRDGVREMPSTHRSGQLRDHACGRILRRKGRCVLRPLSSGGWPGRGALGHRRRDSAKDRVGQRKW